MSIFNGTIYIIAIADVTAGVVGTYTDLQDQTEGSISLSVDIRDITTKDSSGYKRSEYGQRSGSISVSGLADDTSNAVTTLMNKHTNGQRISVKFGVDGTAAGADDDVFTIQGYVSSIEVSAGTEDNVTYSATIETSGSIAHDSSDEPQ